MSQGERPQEKPNVPTPWSWAFRPQTYEKIKLFKLPGLWYFMAAVANLYKGQKWKWQYPLRRHPKVTKLHFHYRLVKANHKTGADSPPDGRSRTHICWPYLKTTGEVVKTLSSLISNWLQDQLGKLGHVHLNHMAFRYSPFIRWFTGSSNWKLITWK